MDGGDISRRGNVLKMGGIKYVSSTCSLYFNKYKDEGESGQLAGPAQWVVTDFMCKCLNIYSDKKTLLMSKIGSHLLCRAIPPRNSREDELVKIKDSHPGYYLRGLINIVIP